MDNTNTFILNVEAVSKIYHSDDSQPVKALQYISLKIPRGDFISIVGPSGCGKTTLLKIIASLISPTSGSVDVSHIEDAPGPDIMFVFQEYNRSLFPWKKVFQNIAFGLERIGLASKDIKDKVLKILEIVGLKDFSSRYPWELSGGMQQRVAIARALVCEPQLLLMDEPFGSLDALSRANLEDDLLRVWKELGITILFVTHDVDEAIYLSDKVVALSPRPSQVLDIINIDLERPRHQIQTKNTPMFGQYREEISKLLGRGDNA